MKKKIELLIKHPIISGSIILFLGSTISSLLNFLFNLYMSKSLSVADYGTLAGLLSISTLFGLLGGAFIPTIVTFAGGYFARGEYDRARGLFYRLMLFFFFIGFAIFISFIFFRGQIGAFFNVKDISLIILIGFTTFIGYVTLINNFFLQAKLSFFFLSINNLFSTILKLLFGVTFIVLGFRVGGAIWAYILSGLIPYFATFIPLRFLLSFKNAPATDIRKIITFGAPAAISLFSLTSFVTTDIILVKHFFSPTDAGIYAGISLIARIIFFFSAPIGTVMFPHIVQKYARKESYHNDFLLSLFLVFLPSLILIFFYFIIPELILTISTKQDYVKGAPMLGFFSIFSTLYALLYIFTNFYLSIKKTIISLPLAVAAILQIVLIWFFHGSFFQVIFISVSVLSLLLIVFLLYYLKLYVKE